MVQVASQVASQVLTLHGDRVILPNTAVAEIIPYHKPDALPGALAEDAPDWLLGLIAWRGLSVPLLSLETVFGGNYAEQGRRSSIAVINAASSIAGSPFFAIVTQGIPRLTQVTPGMLNVIEETGETSKAIACHVVLEGEAAVIPDLDGIESLLGEVFSPGKASSSKKKTGKKNGKKKK